jgi:hypothetical protein
MTRTKVVALFAAVALNVWSGPGPTRCVVQGRLMGIAAGSLTQERKDDHLVPNLFIIRFDSGQRFDSDAALQEKAAKLARDMNGHVVHVYKHVFQGVAIQTDDDAMESSSSTRNGAQLDWNGLESVQQV